MNETSEMWKAHREQGQRIRSSNRESSAAYLRERGIGFSSRNSGAHLIVEGQTCFIDFWPGTGKWHCRSGKKGFGVRNLVEHITGGSDNEI